MKKSILLPVITLMMLNATNSQSQTARTVSGIIYSGNKKQPIQGASIIAKYTGRASASDNNGNFTFGNLTDADTLTFSYIGYTKREIAVSDIGPIPIEVYLSESAGVLDEVIVNTGYSSLPRERATGSFTQIDNELFNRSVGTDLVSRLEGVTNGLLFERPTTPDAPSAAPNLRVRGIMSLWEIETIIFMKSSNISAFSPASSSVSFVVPLGSLIFSACSISISNSPFKLSRNRSVASMSTISGSFMIISHQLCAIHVHL